MTNVLERLRAADPVAVEPDAPPVEWMLARVHAVGDALPPAAAWDVGDIAAASHATPRVAARRDTPPAFSSGGARGCRRPFLAGLATATALAAVGVLAGSWSSSDVVAQASEALSTDDAIIHTLTVDEPLDARGNARARATFVFSRKPRRTGRRAIMTERWSAQNPRRFRAVSTIVAADGGGNAMTETAYAGGLYRWDASYLEGGVKTFRVPKRLRNAETPPPMLAVPGEDPVADVRAFLADRQLEPAGETEVAGRRLVRLRGKIAPERLKSGFVTPEVRVEYLVDPESYEPVRIDQRSFALRRGKLVSTGGHRVTFKTYERLPLTPSSRALLEFRR